MNNKLRGLSAILVLLFTISGQAALVINEIDYDQPGTDNAEFIELYNTGPNAVDMTGYTLEFVNGNGGAVYDTNNLPAISLAAGAYYVFCQDAMVTANCDEELGHSIQNGGPDGVRLLDNTPSIIDGVSYEGTMAGTGEGTSAPTDNGGGGVGGGNDDMGIARLPNGTDTNDNGADFVFQAITPGASNNPAPPSQISIDDVTQVEGDAGTTTFDFTVSIDVTAAATVQVDTADVTTTAGTDYDAIVAQTVTFTDGGPLTQTVSVTVNGDTDLEMDESFNVDLSAPVGATIADAQGVGTITNDDFPSPVAAAVVDNNVSINGGSDGQATASATGGTPGYNFLWSDGQTTATATGLAAGMYTVTVTDQNVQTDTASVTITEPTIVVATVTVVDETYPGSFDGSATVTATGGVPGYTYLWSNGDTTATTTGLGAGTYTVVVTDANGATASPIAPIVVVALGPIPIIPVNSNWMLMTLMLLMGLVVARKLKA
jgi:hypothetical protein